MQTNGWDANLGIRELHWSPWQAISHGLESIFLILCSFLVMDKKLDFKNILGLVIFVYILITLALFSLFRVGTFPFLYCFLSLKILCPIFKFHKNLYVSVPHFISWQCCLVHFPWRETFDLGWLSFFFFFFFLFFLKSKVVFVFLTFCLKQFTFRI